MHFNDHRHKPCAGFSSRGAVAGSCLCNPMTTHLYLAEKVVARICPAQFFLHFQCSESHRQRPERHIGPDGIWAERRYWVIHLPGLSIGSLVPRNYVDIHGRANTLHAQHSPCPQNEELLVLWVLWWLLSVILRQEDKHKMFKGEMDYYLIVYVLKRYVRHLIFISFQCGMEKKYQVQLMV